MGKSGRHSLSAILILLLTACQTFPSARPVPDGFVDVSQHVPGAVFDIRYHSHENFVGRPIGGYEKPACLLAAPAAQALGLVQKELMDSGLSLKIFDCYRPQHAVADFVSWAKDLDDQKTKTRYYPDVPKEELFSRGYIAATSGHSRGSTVDLTLLAMDARANQKVKGQLLENGEVDMGTPFDFFGEESHTENRQMPADIQYNRRWLKALMEKHGFRNLPEEWWHFTLEAEPYPDHYFDFPIR